MGKGNDPNCADALAMPAPDLPARRPRRPPPDLADALSVLYQPASGSPRVPSRDEFLAVHDFTYGELRVVADPDHHDHWVTDLSFRGKVLDGRGEQVGYVGRRLTVCRDDNRLVSLDARLRLDDEHRGGEFGAAWSAYCDDQYRQLGVHRHRITATEVGAYLWAKPGTLFDPRPSQIAFGSRFEDQLSAEQLAVPGRAGAFCAQQLLREYDTARLEFAVYDGTLDVAEVRAFRRQFATDKDIVSERWRRRFHTPHQIAQWGRERPFTGPDGERTWLGKWFLLGPQRLLLDPRHRLLVWHGVRLLADEPA